MSTASNIDRRDREGLIKTARGFFAETLPLEYASGSGGFTGASGIASYSAIGLIAGDLITNLTLSISILQPGAGLTLSKLGVYSKTGAQLAVTADQGASWQTGGAKTVPLIAPLLISATDLYYIAELAVGTTPPALVRGSGGNAFGQFNLPGFLATYYGQTGLADLPSQATFATGISLASCFWCGLT